MLKVFLISLVLLLAAVLLMAVRIMLKKGGKFSSQHISESRAMREQGITCATSTDRRDRKMAEKKMNIKEL